MVALYSYGAAACVAMDTTEHGARGGRRHQDVATRAAGHPLKSAIAEGRPQALNIAIAEGRPRAFAIGIAEGHALAAGAVAMAATDFDPSSCPRARRPRG